MKNYKKKGRKCTGSLHVLTTPSAMYNDAVTKSKIAVIFLGNLFGFRIDRPVLRCHITRPPGAFIADEAAGGQVKGQTWEIFLTFVLLKCFGIFCY